MPRTVNDPVIENQFKRKHYDQYKEIMASQANEALIKKGVIPENIYEQDVNIGQKLEDFDDFLHSRKTSVCTPTNSEHKIKEYSFKKQKIDNGFNGMNNIYNEYNGAGMDHQHQFVNGLNSFSG